MRAENEPREAWVVLNHQAVPSSQAKVSPLCAGLQLGHGAYTSFVLQEGLPVFFHKHVSRLANDAAVLGLEMPSEERLLADVRLCAERNQAVAAALKILLFKDLAGTSCLVQLRPPSPLEQARQRGCRLMSVVGPAACTWVARHKVSSYLPHLLARQTCQAEGFDEALWVTSEGEALECAGANLFVVVEGRILTPPVQRGVLPGIVRQVLLERLPEAREEAVSADLLAAANEMFITNSLIGVLSVSSLDAKVLDPLNRPAATRAAGLLSTRA